MTGSSRLPILAVSAVALCAAAATIWLGVSVRELSSQIDTSRKASDMGTATIIENLESVRGDLAMLRDTTQAATTEDEPVDGAQEIQFKTDADAAAAIASLSKNPTAESFAAVIGEIDGWVIRPQDQDAVNNRLVKLIPHLRAMVKAQVIDLQTAALNVTPSAAGVKKLDEAGKILALYPMSDDPAVIKEATLLTDRQMDAASRLDALRRQRYNKWAINQVEQAINYYNENVSKWNPMNDNTALLPPLVTQLGPVDPMFLEPAVLDLYNYIIDKMKGSLSEKNKLEFAKQLTDPKISRKALGDL